MVKTSGAKKKLTIHTIDCAPFLLALFAVILTLTIPHTILSCVKIRLIVGIFPVIVCVWLHGDDSAGNRLTPDVQ